MKRIISLLVAFSLIISLSTAVKSNVVKKNTENKTKVTKLAESKIDKKYIEKTFKSDSLNNKALIRFSEKRLYRDLVKKLNSDKYFVDEVRGTYFSKEYIEELAANTKKNIYFGYTAAELNKQFKGQKYVFALGENGTTVVKPLETINDDIYVKSLENTIVGSGIIMFCVTVSIVTAPTAPAFSMIMMSSAKDATAFALSGASLTGITKAFVDGLETGNVEDAFKSGISGASEGFKVGAILGSLSGGAKAVKGLKAATKSGLTMNQAAFIQKESKYPLSVIKNIKSIDEYNIYKKHGLTPEIIDGKNVLTRNVNIDYKSVYNGKRITNLQRMKKGLAPIEPKKGKPYELHHVNQEKDGVLAILTYEEHHSKTNFSILHVENKEGVHNKISGVSNTQWAKTKKELWKAYAETFN